jgi:hypothetical protein
MAEIRRRSKQNQWDWFKSLQLGQQQNEGMCSECLSGPSIAAQSTGLHLHATATVLL